MVNKEKKLKRMIHVTDVHLRETTDGDASRTITGYAVLFNTPSAPLYEDETETVREIIEPTAITRELLDKCDIKMTMFHDRQIILARSKNGTGTLSYEVDDKGVQFTFEAPHTVDGDKALELVRRGDISGCSFIFCTPYYDPEFVNREISRSGKKVDITYRVKTITDILDFTLAADPAYPDTNCETAARELAKWEEEPKRLSENAAEQIREMREISKIKIL